MDYRVWLFNWLVGFLNWLVGVHKLVSTGEILNRLVRVLKLVSARGFLNWLVRVLKLVSGVLNWSVSWRTPIISSYEVALDVQSVL